LCGAFEPGFYGCQRYGRGIYRRPLLIIYPYSNAKARFSVYYSDKYVMIPPTRESLLSSRLDEFRIEFDGTSCSLSLSSKAENW
jgi:hypothetical protein